MKPWVRDLRERCVRRSRWGSRHSRAFPGVLVAGRPVEVGGADGVPALHEAVEFASCLLDLVAARRRGLEHQAGGVSDEQPVSGFEERVLEVDGFEQSCDAVLVVVAYRVRAELLGRLFEVA